MSRAANFTIKKPKEKTVQSQVCQYIKLQYPRVIFNSDAAGVRLTMGQSVQMKKLRSGNGFPDVMIFEPRGNYSGLLLELKREDTRIWLKDNSLSIDEHIREQYEMLTQLNERGFFATFALGFIEAKEIIDNYLKQKQL